MEVCIRHCKALFQVLYFYINLGLIYFARRYESALHKKGKYNHAIIIIGDNHALGLGGHIRIPGGSGITQKLGKELAKETSIRQTWQIYNRGEYKTSTDDWLLPTDSRRLKKPTLLLKVLQDPKYLKAEIVIVMLGSQDALNDSGVLRGLDLDQESNFEYRRKNLYWHDGRHFNDIGHAKMAKDWVPFLQSDMVKREFSLYRSDLGLEDSS
ncbi:hypothetical protein BGZ94_009648 [Podila epigama]|nr:hypothetical protein BGZ94_009648 [Podila epigama]